MGNTPLLTIRCEYPDLSSPPSEVSFRLSPRYGIHDAREAHDWFLLMMRSHEEFVVETDKPGEWPMPFRSEMVRTVVVVWVMTRLPNPTHPSFKPRKNACLKQHLLRTV